MTRFESRLLEIMSVRRWLVACAVLCVLFGGAGFWLGVVHERQVIAGALTDAREDFGRGLAKWSQDVQRDSERESAMQKKIEEARRKLTTQP